MGTNDFDMLRLKLEEASKIVTSSIVSKEQRQMGENLFIEFRSSKSPYDLCKFLLETSREPYVLFQAVYTLKDAAIREWSMMSSSLFTELENFLLNYVIANIKTCDRYVQRQILQAISVLYKRRKLCTKGSQLPAASRPLVEIVIELFKTNELIEIKSLCCSLLAALLNEFSNTNRSSNIGLSCTSHLNAKCAFEKSEFKILLNFTKEVLQQVLLNPVLNSQSYRDLVLQLLCLIEQSFNWEFTSSNNVFRNTLKPVEQTQATQSTLKPTPEFRDFFLDSTLIEILFGLYEILRPDNETAHICIQSIIQLSTINGPVFNDDPSLKPSFLEAFLRQFNRLYGRGSLQDYELLNVSSLIENLLLTFNINDYTAVDANNKENVTGIFFRNITEFLINCFNAEKSLENESRKFFDTYEKILLAIIRFKEFQNGKLFEQYSESIVISFINSRLQTSTGESATGFNFNKNLDNFDNELIDEDIVEDDLQRYRDVLFTISELSRCRLDISIPYLSKLLTERLYYLTQTLSKVTMLTSKAEIDSQTTRYLNNLNEDVHWLLLISGFILFDIDNDIESTIPTEVMNFSINIRAHVNLEVTKSLFTQKLNNITFTETDLSFCDPICVLVYLALQSCELEKQMQPINMMHHMSPQVASTLMWFLKEFSRNYLFMSEKNIVQISETFHQTFGQETESGIMIVNYLMSKLYSNFFIWSSENNVTTQTANLFHKLVRNTEICKYLFKNEIYWSISKICIDNDMPWIILPSTVKKLIIKSLIISLSWSNYDSANAMFIETIIKPLIQRFEMLLTKPDPHVESVIKEVMSLIETFNGIIEGTSSSLVKQLFPFILPRLSQSVQLLDVYHNYGEIVELILCMFNGIIESYLFYLDQDSSNQVYMEFLSLIRVFSKHNKGKRSIEANIEEDYYNDLLLFMTLLNTLQNKDLMQELFDNPNTSATLTNTTIENIRLTSVDVVLHGLNFLIPLMNQEMLKFQALCSEYFKLISTISESNPAKIFSTPVELYSALISSIEYGFASGSGTDITRLCFECVEFLSKYVFQKSLQQTDYGVLLRKLFQTVFNVIFRCSIEFELFEPCAYALYGLVCCFHNTYTELVNGLLVQYADEQLRNTIIQGFQQLTPNNFQFNLEKKNRVKFVERFNQFCVQTYGLLFIK